MGRKLYNEVKRTKYLWVLHVRQPGLKVWQHWSGYGSRKEAEREAQCVAMSNWTTRILKYQLVKEG